MSSSPLVSVLIPVYNAGEYLKEAVLSIINQTYTYLEIIIIDDGSTDNCIDTINTITDSRIKLIRQKNSGKAVALNRALEKLQGDYFIIQDADDKSYPTRIEEQLKCLNANPKLAAVYVGHDLILNDKNFAPIFIENDEKKCLELIKAFKMPAHDATGMYRMSLLQDMRFDESLRLGQGVDFVLRVGEKFPITLIGQCLYSYRINYNSAIRQDLDKTVISENTVRKKACQRRNLNFDMLKVSSQKKNLFAKTRTMDSDIIPHCIESIICLKCHGNFLNAFSVGLQCIILRPLNFFYYKPLCYIIIPIKLIDLYRKLKIKIGY